jgi:hypothetical protein
MRLWKAETKAVATRELLEIVRANPGIRTTEMIGTPRFHGMRTLRAAQVIALLRAAGLRPTLEGAGARTYFTWSLANSDIPEGDLLRPAGADGR